MRPWSSFLGVCFLSIQGEQAYELARPVLRGVWAEPSLTGSSHLPCESSSSHHRGLAEPSPVFPVPVIPHVKSQFTCFRMASWDYACFLYNSRRFWACHYTWYFNSILNQRMFWALEGFLHSFCNPIKVTCTCTKSNSSGGKYVWKDITWKIKYLNLHLYTQSYF